MGDFLKKIKDDMYAKYWQLFFVNFLFDKKIKCLTILMVQVFIFFGLIINLRMSDCFETCGSAEIRTIFMNDEEGKLIKSDSLFENLYDFWSCFHMSYKTLFIWYHPKMAQLEKAIRRKWVTTKDLPLVNIVLKKFKEKDNYFNPMRYLEGDEEKYFKISQQWKIFFFCYRLNFF